MTNPSNAHPPIGVAFEWVSRILAVCVMMVGPGLAGQWLDERWGTSPLLTFLGFAFGLTAAIWHLITVTKVKPRTRDLDSGSVKDQRDLPRRGQSDD